MNKKTIATNNHWWLPRRDVFLSVTFCRVSCWYRHLHPDFHQYWRLHVFIFRLNCMGLEIPDRWSSTQASPPTLNIFATKSSHGTQFVTTLCPLLDATRRSKDPAFSCPFTEKQLIWLTNKTERHSSVHSLGFLTLNIEIWYKTCRPTVPVMIWRMILQWTTYPIFDCHQYFIWSRHVLKVRK